MKKIIFVAATLFASTLVFSVSYKNNTYQKLANEYTKKAAAALDAGEYELSMEYSKKAEENAALSQAYIKKMLAKAEADKAMKKASERIEFAKKIDAERNFPMAFDAATRYYEAAKEVYANEDYPTAVEYANQVLSALADIKEVTPLPQFYVVRPWAETKDCYWNISGRSYVYNNPLLWENLYQANKTKMPKPNDPNLIHPGMKMEIPSITGEYRSGVYNPAKKYDGYSAVASRQTSTAKPVKEVEKVEETKAEVKEEVKEVVENSVPENKVEEKQVEEQKTETVENAVVEQPTETESNKTSNSSASLFSNSAAGGSVVIDEK